MDATLQLDAPSRPTLPLPRRPAARTLYAALLRERDGGAGRVDDLTRAQSRAFLSDRLASAACLPNSLPSDPRGLPTWLEAGQRQVAVDYRRYLAERKAGQPRRYFANRSHALYFLTSAAPTKLVDGAWLYGLLPRWNDLRFGGLVRTYLEELGDGQANRNHVLLYRKLLQDQGCEAVDHADDGLYLQGAIQLSLARHADEFLPEVIGFNLGYEQLPLHLLITAHELAELGIDPYYFTLHVTVDNASTGHARRSLQSVFDTLPRLGDEQAFYRRVCNGFRLNDLGLGTVDLIDSFDLRRELTAMLARKAAVGSGLHSDYCRIAGRTVNEWLGDPHRMPEFLDAMVDNGWIKRHRDPAESRFWQLLQGDAPPMFGVFSRYEQQLIHDWIGDDWVDSGGSGDGSPQRPARRFVRRPGPASAEPMAAPVAIGADASVAEIVDAHFADLPGGALDAELQLLRERLATAQDRHELMARLIGLLSPAQHPTPAGLLATRIFASVGAPQAR